MQGLCYPDVDMWRIVGPVIEEDGSTWRVFLKKPAHLPSIGSGITHGYCDTPLEGKGDSPENAYKDLLKKTFEVRRILYGSDFTRALRCKI